MDENVEVVEEVVDFGSADIVAELQYLRTEVASANAAEQKMHSDITLLVMLVAVLVVYEVRNVFLSFVKKGGIKGV